MTEDRRKRPWKKVRVVVEVTVPPTNRTTEADLRQAVAEKLGYYINLPGNLTGPRYEALLRVKALTAFWPVFKRIELGLKPHGRPATRKN